MLTSNQD